LVAVLDGEVIAHLSIHRDKANASHVEVAYPVCHPDHVGVLPEIFAKAWSVLSRQRERQGWKMLYYFSLCDRHEMQLLGSSLLETTEVAICPGYLPNFDQLNGNGLRSDILITQKIFEPQNEEPLTVFIPQKHREIVHFLYQPLGLNRNFSTNGRAKHTKPHLSADAAAVERQFFRRTGVEQAFVRPSLLGSSATLLKRIKRKDRHSRYLYLDLADPQTPVLAEQLEDQGFRFSGILPLFHNTDSIVYFEDTGDPLELSGLIGERGQALAHYMVTKELHFLSSGAPKAKGSRVKSSANV
jgi:hypothetical protein